MVHKITKDYFLLSFPLSHQLITFLTNPDQNIKYSNNKDQIYLLKKIHVKMINTLYNSNKLITTTIIIKNNIRLKVEKTLKIISIVKYHNNRNSFYNNNSNNHRHNKISMPKINKKFRAKNK